MTGARSEVVSKCTKILYACDKHEHAPIARSRARRTRRAARIRSPLGCSATRSRRASGYTFDGSCKSRDRGNEHDGSASVVQGTRNDDTNHALYAVRAVAARFVPSESIDATLPTSRPSYMNPPCALHENLVSMTPVAAYTARHEPRTRSLGKKRGSRGSLNVADSRTPPQMYASARCRTRLSRHSTHTRHHTTRSLRTICRTDESQDDRSQSEVKPKGA